MSPSVPGAAKPDSNPAGTGRTSSGLGAGGPPHASDSPPCPASPARLDRDGGGTRPEDSMEPCQPEAERGERQQGEDVRQDPDEASLKIPQRGAGQVAADLDHRSLSTLASARPGRPWALLDLAFGRNVFVLSRGHRAALATIPLKLDHGGPSAPARFANRPGSVGCDTAHAADPTPGRLFAAESTLSGIRAYAVGRFAGAGPRQIPPRPQ